MALIITTVTDELMYSYFTYTNFHSPRAFIDTSWYLLVTSPSDQSITKAMGTMPIYIAMNTTKDPIQLLTFLSDSV